MSVAYGRYVVSYDGEDNMWNADPKGKYLMVGNEHKTYTFPESQVFVEKTKQLLMQKMREEGATKIHCRRGEWVVYMGDDVTAKE